MVLPKQGKVHFQKQEKKGGGGGTKGAPNMKESLSFETLEQHVRVAMPVVPIIRKTKPARAALLVGVLGALIALFGVNAESGDWRGWFTLLGLVAEVVGFATYFAIELRHELPQFVEAKLNFARELEKDYGPNLAVLTWLRRFDRDHLEERAAYLRQRQAMMSRRFSLVVGAVDKLGVLPVLAAGYLQFKDLGFPPQLDHWQGVLGFLLIGMYVLSLWLAGLKLRLDLYVGLFEAALQGQSGQAPRQHAPNVAAASKEPAAIV